MLPRVHGVVEAEHSRRTVGGRTMPIFDIQEAGSGFWFWVRRDWVETKIMWVRLSGLGRDGRVMVASVVGWMLLLQAYRQVSAHDP